MKTGLQGLVRWVSVPSTLSGVACGALAVLYEYLTLDFPPGTLGALGGCIVAVMLAAVGVAAWQEQRSLPVLRRLSAGAAPTRELLRDAVREVAQLPDSIFWVNLGSWWGGAAALGLAWGQVSPVSFELSARVAFIGLALGPLASTLAYLGVVTRSRVAITRLAAAGLSPAEVIAAIPPARMQLQRRLIIYAAVAVGTPMLLVCGLAVQRTERTFSAVLAQDTAAAQRAALTAQADAGLLSLFVIAAVVMGVVVICSYISGSALRAPMRALAEKTRRMAGGKLGGTTVVAGEDEIWATVAGFATLESQLVLVISQLQDAGQKIQNTTTALTSSRARHERGAGDQTAALAQTSATTEELARSARQIATNATFVADLATQTLTAARQGKQNADQFYVSILKVREGNQAIADSVVKLNKRVQQVGRIVEFIDGIADKSDLLALNAELEGNKAGEVGRGFSLVAAEMRRLSESVMTSTREIIGLIDEVRDATNAAVMATEAGVKASDTGSALARKVSEGLSDILSYATTTADAVQRITLATHQQQVGTDQLAQAMNDILRSTRAGEGSSKRMSGANEELEALARELEGTVARFEVT